MKRIDVRASSIQQLSRLNLRFLPPPHLPTLGDLKITRSEEDIETRFLCLLLTIHLAFGADREKIFNLIYNYGLINNLAIEEKNIINTKTIHKKPEAIAFNLIERLFALSWKVGIVPSIDLDIKVPESFAKSLPRASDPDFRKKFRQYQGQNNESVIATLDLYYCAHWSLQESSLNKSPFHENIHPQTIVNRRITLEWLVGQSEWDDVRLDT